MNLRLLSFLSLFLFSFNAEARLVDKTAAIVNSDVITYADTVSFAKNFSLRRELDPFINFFRVQPQKNNEVIDYLIQENLILQKFPATKDEVEEEINAVQKNNQIDREKLKTVLSAQGVKFEIYTTLMKVSVSKRKLMDRELRPLSNISDEDVKNYYYTSTEYSAKNKAQKLVLTYDLSLMLFPSKQLADDAAKQLRSGDDFDALATELAPKGIENTHLGSLSEDKLNESIRSALSGLRVGQSSAPVQNTAGGYQIIKINQIGAPKDAEFEKNKEQVRNTLFQKTMHSQLTIWTEKEKAQSYIFIP